MVILSRGTARGSWRIGGRRGIQKRVEKRAGGVGSKMVESGRNRGKLKGFKGGSQEKRGRIQECKVQGAGGLDSSVHPLFKSYIFELLLFSIL